MIVDVEIINCEFVRNRSLFHGGAIFVQTCGNVLIESCEFDSNEADFQEQSSKALLVTKNHGFGGAIYINNTDCSMNFVDINKCIFKDNCCYQGLSIYIEGEECNTIFSINNNTFINNLGCKNFFEFVGVVASEIFSIKKRNIIDNNVFSTTANVEPFIYVDHFGYKIPDETPTASQSLTESPTQSPSETPDPTQILYDSAILDHYYQSKSNYIVFNCPVQHGLITMYFVCSNCNKVSSTEKLWVKINFENANISNITHQDIMIHNSVFFSVFVPSNRISYEQNTNTLLFFIDSYYMKYNGSIVDLKCYDIPQTLKATPSQSPTSSPTSSPTLSPTQSPQESPTQSPSETPDPTRILYDSAILDHYYQSKSNYIVFNCPVQHGSITMYFVCSNCNKVSSTEKLWLKINFENANISNITHQDIMIHNSVFFSVFVPSNRISYEQNTNTLLFFIDSYYMKYNGSIVDLKCYDIPQTFKATPSQSPTSSPTLSPTQSPQESPTQSPTSSPTSPPTQAPQESPTQSPTSSPTLSPTQSPQESPQKSPTSPPTQSPQESPTQSPTSSPTLSPTQSPQESPTSSPTQSPQELPTQSPQELPTQSPHETPIESSTNSPTESPTQIPIELPSEPPTESQTFLETSSDGWPSETIVDFSSFAESITDTSAIEISDSDGQSSDEINLTEIYSESDDQSSPFAFNTFASEDLSLSSHFSDELTTEVQTESTEISPSEDFQSSFVFESPEPTKLTDKNATSSSSTNLNDKSSKTKLIAIICAVVAVLLIATIVAVVI